MVRSETHDLFLSGSKPQPSAASEVASRTAPFQLAPGVLAQPRPPTSAAMMRLTKRGLAEAAVVAPTANLQMPSRAALPANPPMELPEELKRALTSAERSTQTAREQMESVGHSAAAELRECQSRADARLAESRSKVLELEEEVSNSAKRATEARREAEEVAKVAEKKLEANEQRYRTQAEAAA